MKDYIDKMIRNAERALEAFYSYISECKDGDLVADSYFLYRAFISSRNVVSVYHRHWKDEFTARQEKRVNRLYSPDIPSSFLSYLDKYGS